jgi:subtilisin
MGAVRRPGRSAEVHFYRPEHNRDQDGADPMAKKSNLQQYVLLPPRGLRPESPAVSQTAGAFFASMSVSQPKTKEAAEAMIASVNAGQSVRVLDSIHEDGAKLVEMTAEMASNLRTTAPGVRIVPVVYYSPAVAPRMTVIAGPKIGKARRPKKPPVKAGKKAKAKAKAVAAAPPKISVKVVSRLDGKAVSGATVVAFTDFANRVGDQGRTNARGVVSLNLGAASKKLQRLYVYPEDSFWGSIQQGVTISSRTVVTLEPIDFNFVDALRHFYGNAGDDVGVGVTVGVIDSGVDTNHPDLTVQGGENTVTGESPGDFGDNGGHHGTHVAGIIAAHGQPGKGMRGVAPGATLRSYRVFGEGSDSASNFAIAKAIDRAVADGCDLINMSLGGGPQDPATSSAIADARAAGSLVIIAAGNDSRGPVSFPAADPRAIAVSAMGRVGTFPTGAVEEGDVQAPFGTDKANFIAAFSNIGPQIALTGTGVGIISTVPGGYAIMDGTSMACPAVTGVAARLLSMPANAVILSMPRDQTRSDAMAQLLLQSAVKLGFGPTFEGQGLPQP